MTPLPSSPPDHSAADNSTACTFDGSSNSSSSTTTILPDLGAGRDGERRAIANAKQRPRKTRRRKKSPNAFPCKLYRMLNDAERDQNQHIVSWVAGGKGFLVHNVDAFVKHIMPRYFRQTKYRSFTRQIQLYGFLRQTMDPYRGSYHHPDFMKQREDLCNQLSRQNHHAARKLVLLGTTTNNGIGATGQPATLPPSEEEGGPPDMHVLSPSPSLTPTQTPVPSRENMWQSWPSSANATDTNNNVDGDSASSPQQCDRSATSRNSVSNEERHVQYNDQHEEVPTFLSSSSFDDFAVFSNSHADDVEDANQCPNKQEQRTQSVSCLVGSSRVSFVGMKFFPTTNDADRKLGLDMQNRPSFAFSADGFEWDGW